MKTKKIDYKSVLMEHKKFLEDEIQLEMEWFLDGAYGGENIILRHMHKVGIYQKILINLLEKLLNEKTS